MLSLANKSWLCGDSTLASQLKPSYISPKHRTKTLPRSDSASAGRRAPSQEKRTLKVTWPEV